MLQRIRTVAGYRWATRLTVLALTALARGHDVTPTSISIPPGGENAFYVVDQFGCPATIRATSLYPNVVQVYAVDMDHPTVLLPGNGAIAAAADRVDQLFVVRVSSNATPMTAQIEVCWIGSTAPNPPCPENNCSPAAPHIVVVQITAAAKSTGGNAFCGIVGDPIASDDAELFFDEPADLNVRGPMPLAFQRYYASRLLADGVAAGSLGSNWTHNFDWRLSELGSVVEITMPTGRRLRFERVLGQTWKQTVYEDQPFQLVDDTSDKLLGDPRTGLTRRFDSNGRLKEIADGKGNVHTLSYAGANLSTVSDGLGATLTLGYTSNRLTSVGDGTRSVTFGYTSNLLTSATDARGKTTTYAYSAAHPGQALLTTRMRPEGNVPWTQTYDLSSRVSSQADASTHTTMLAFDSATRETTITDPLANEQVHTHSTNAELAKLEDEVGKNASMTYDSKKRRTSVTDRLGKTTSWTWHAASGQLASLTAPNGAKTSYGYTARTSGGLTFYDLTSIQRADGTDEAFQHDAQGNLTRWTDPATNAWNYTYNAHGQALTATNPLGGVTTNTYNANGTLATSMDDASNVTGFAYDALRRLMTLTRPDLATVSYTYDANDHLLTITDELSRTTTLAYDDNGNLATITDPTPAMWTLSYDAMDRLESVTDPLGHSAAIAFDELGRPATLTSAAGDVLTLGYDALGNLTTVGDELTNTWTSSYDAEGVPSASIDPLSNATTVTTDALGRPTAITSPLGRRVQFAYDSLGRITQARDASGAATTFTYDSRGSTASVSLPVAGATTSLTRNELGQITAIDQPGAADSSFAYDAQGRPTSATDPIGRATSFAYDTRGRLDQATLPGALGSVDFTWDDADQLTRAQYADGTDLNFAYDENGRLTTADGLSLAYDAAGRMSDSNGLVIGRDADGRVTSIQFAPGKSVAYAYDARGLLATITDWLGGVTSYDYDDAGRLTALTRPNGIVTSYAYDADGRVTSIVETPTSPFPLLVPATRLSMIDVQYDSRGNISHIDRATPRSALPKLKAISYAYDPAGQVVDWVFDDLGREVHRDDFWVNDDGYWANSDGGYWANYDRGSRVSAISIAHNIRQFIHDGFGEEIGISDSSGDEVYVRNYALPERPIQVLRKNGNDQIYFIFNPAGGLVYSVDAVSDSRSYYHFDEQLSTNFLSNDAGVVTDSYAYSPFGVELAHNGSTRNPFTFRGYRGCKREHAGLYFYKGDFYDAEAARYLIVPERQILIDPANPNPFAFSRGNPLSEIANAATLLTTPTTSTAADYVDTAAVFRRLFAHLGAAGCSTKLEFGVSSASDYGVALTASYQNKFSNALGISASDVYSSLASASAPNFQSYVIAQSHFASSNGFAVTANVGARNLAMGYLALALPEYAQASSGAPLTASDDRAPHNYRDLVDKLRKKFPQIPRIRYRPQVSYESGIHEFYVLLNPKSASQSTGNFAGAAANTVIGGSSNERSSMSIPQLSHLPAISALFRNRTDAKERRNLLVFVRSTIVPGVQE